MPPITRPELSSMDGSGLLSKLPASLKLFSDARRQTRLHCVPPSHFQVPCSKGPKYLSVIDSYTPIAQVFRGTLRRQLLIAYEAQRLGHGPHPAPTDADLDAVCAELKRLTPRPGLVESLQRLKQAGFHVWAVSNGAAANTQGLYKAAAEAASVSLTDIGLEVFSTDEVKKAKPDLEVVRPGLTALWAVKSLLAQYHAARKRANIQDGDEAWFVAAHSWSVHPAYINDV
jgi:hypothetical protein